MVSCLPSTYSHIYARTLGIASLAGHNIYTHIHAEQVSWYAKLNGYDISTVGEDRTGGGDGRRWGVCKYKN